MGVWSRGMSGIRGGGDGGGWRWGGVEMGGGGDGTEHRGGTLAGGVGAGRGGWRLPMERERRQQVGHSGSTDLGPPPLYQPALRLEAGKQGKKYK